MSSKTKDKANNLKNREKRSIKSLIEKYYGLWKTKDSKLVDKIALNEGVYYGRFEFCKFKTQEANICNPAPGNIGER